MSYKGVEIHILDETSFMHTKTLKSIDGCITTAKCKMNGYDRVIFESGGNTGTALTQYGINAGLETYLVIPEENLSLLNGSIFNSKKAHLFSVEDPGLVKEAASLLGRIKELTHIPETAWRYEAAMFRGCFILEHLLENRRFDWLTQTISAAFGPIGIYRILGRFRSEVPDGPRFLGIQQEVNSPMYKAWKSKSATLEPTKIRSTKELLTRVMYDVRPYSYGSYQDLRNLLTETDGDLTTINHGEFAEFLNRDFSGKGILDLLRDRGLDITLQNGEVVEKTGLLALAGTLLEIDRGKITKGAKVLCAMTSGISEADGKAEPEMRISTLDDLKGKPGRRGTDV